MSFQTTAMTQSPRPRVGENSFFERIVKGFSLSEFIADRQWILCIAIFPLSQHAVGSDCQGLLSRIVKML